MGKRMIERVRLLHFVRNDKSICFFVIASPDLSGAAISWIKVIGNE